MKSIKEILISRDGLSPAEADDLIAEARQQLSDYLEEGNISDAEDICSEFFSLEPDYLDQLY